MSSTLQEIPAAVLKVLTLPALPGLDEDRAAGRVCVWGGERLAIETAVDLGEQVAPSRSGDERWFPRACRACVADRAHRDLFAHGTTCTRCADPDAECPVGRGLYRLVRDARR
ncbi:hypothetical protein ACWEQ1_00975 [Streptomyces nodosus]